ncbi:SusC/RagA family TonB-linked outer membrane protein [Saccharicrinis sp. 156]|uniref:SusC/RagA family TonB-linked outer membrane protein n=1 Tax=Saccharicrinis sp. 156 TaxID=3417574 RepID=UPI003D32685C
MKQYIVTLSLALLCMLCVDTVKAQEVNDSIKQELIELPYGKVSKDRLVGSIDVITKEDLMQSGYPTLSNALAWKVPGYLQGRVRGYSRGGTDDQPLVIIDGLSNRFLSSVMVDEVESVHILKDVTAKMLYGSKAANGVIVVKTKRGKNAKRKFTVTGDYGLRMANEYPEYVGAADYMKYNNQARMNDGLDPLYLQEDIDMAGSSYKYPDVDFYDMFLEDQTNFQKVNTQLIGGDDKTKYFFNMGYFGESGLEAVGDKSRTDAFNLRSNLDYKVNNVITVNLDIAGRFYNVEGNRLSDSNFFSALSGTKPNDYPIFISDQPHADSLGTSAGQGGSNLYGDMVYAGYKRDATSFAQTNIGMDFDFDKYVKGLQARVFATFDVNNYISEGKKLEYRTLKPDVTALGQDTLIVNGISNPKGNEQRLADSYYRNMGGGAYINYDRTFGNHAILADASYMLETLHTKTNVADMSTVQDDKTMNFGLRVNYAFQNKYIAEYSGSYMGSRKFHKDNRWKLFNSFGVSYIVSEEDFMDNVDFIDYLKVKASYGKMGYDKSFDYLLYNNYYKYWAGSYTIGVTNSDQLVGTEYIQAGNTGLTYEESEELNIGLTMRMLNNRLELGAEYFEEERTGMPTEMKYAFPQTSGEPTIYDNYNAIENKGFEVTAQFTDKVGDFTYSLGGYLTSYESKWTQYDELNQFSFQNEQGTETDAIWGYVADGFYTTADDVATYGADGSTPLTSSLGSSLIPGDIKFKDMSDTQSEYTYNDNVINSYDRVIIGNSRPRYIYGININLKYKDVSLYALGQGVGGFDRTLTWPTYFTNKGNVKYSEYVYDAAVPTFDGEGNAVGLVDNNFTKPRLSTEGNAHSYNTNTYLMQKGYYFKLRTVELAYKLPKTVSSAIFADQLNVFVRGDNLFTISDLDDRDPDNVNAGITGNPTFKTVSGGVKLVF